MGDEKEDKLGVGDVIKKVVSIGVGAAFLTEDAVKGLLKDVPLPKDIVSGLVQNAKGAKEDFTEGLREEFKKYLAHLDVNKVTEFLVENYDVEVNAKFSFKRKNGKGKKSE